MTSDRPCDPPLRCDLTEVSAVAHDLTVRQGGRVRKAGASVKRGPVSLAVLELD